MDGVRFIVNWVNKQVAGYCQIQSINGLLQNSQRTISGYLWFGWIILKNGFDLRDELFSLSSGLKPIPVLAMASHESRRYGVAPNAIDETINAIKIVLKFFRRSCSYVMSQLSHIYFHYFPPAHTLLLYIFGHSLPLTFEALSILLLSNRSLLFVNTWLIGELTSWESFLIVLDMWLDLDSNVSLT
jgi:hypothetical protein